MVKNRAVTHQLGGGAARRAVDRLPAALVVPLPGRGCCAGPGNGGVAEHGQEGGGVRVALDDVELDGVGDHPVGRRSSGRWAAGRSGRGAAGATLQVWAKPEPLIRTTVPGGPFVVSTYIKVSSGGTAAARSPPVEQRPSFSSVRGTE